MSERRRRKGAGAPELTAHVHENEDTRPVRGSTQMIRRSR